MYLFLSFDVLRKDTRLHIHWNRKEGNVLFNDALNTFYLRLYGVGHMVKDNSDSERRNPLLPHRLLFPISSNGSFDLILRDIRLIPIPIGLLVLPCIR